MAAASDLTDKLRRARAGDRAALDEVFAAVYRELHELARAQRRRWDGDYTLNTTALVHEAYLKLVSQRESPSWTDRAHFLAVGATAMRHVLVNYAQARRAQKRGGGAEPIPLEEATLPIADGTADEILALDEALARLAAIDARQAQVVEARFFAGLTVDEVAAALRISAATVKRDWQVAGAWLQREVRRSLAEP